jgi:hypothetical protein
LGCIEFRVLFGGFRGAGAELGVLTVCVDLCLGCHVRWWVLFPPKESHTALSKRVRGCGHLEGSDLECWDYNYFFVCDWQITDLRNALDMIVHGSGFSLFS